jgi:hypothetical protein
MLDARVIPSGWPISGRVCAATPRRLPRHGSRLSALASPQSEVVAADGTNSKRADGTGRT